MRILFVVRFYSHLANIARDRTWRPHGMPAFYKLLEALSASGCRVEVLLLSRHSDREFVTASGFRCEGLPNVEFRVLPIATTQIPGRLGWMWTQWLQIVHVFRRLSRCRFDLVYCDRAHVVPGAVVAWLGRKVALRLFGVAGLPETLGREKIEFAPRFQRMAFRAPFAVVICTQDGSPGKTFMDRYLRSSVPRHLLLNGVDMDVLSGAHPPGEDFRASRGLPPDTLVLLSIGRLEKDRRPVELVRALGDLKERFEAFHLFFLGEGSLREELEAEVGSHALDEQVSFLGSVPHTTVLACLKQSDILISISDLANLNNSVLEGIAAGRCVVTLDPDPESGRDSAFVESGLSDAVERLPRVAFASALTERLAELAVSRDRVDAVARKARAAADRYIPTWPKRIDHELALLRSATAGNDRVTRSSTRG